MDLAPVPCEYRPWLKILRKDISPYHPLLSHSWDQQMPSSSGWWVELSSSTHIGVFSRGLCLCRHLDIPLLVSTPTSLLVLCPLIVFGVWVFLFISLTLHSQWFFRSIFASVCLMISTTEFWKGISRLPYCWNRTWVPLGDAAHSVFVQSLLIHWGSAQRAPLVLTCLHSQQPCRGRPPAPGHTLALRSGPHTHKPSSCFFIFLVSSATFLLHGLWRLAFFRTWAWVLSSLNMYIMSWWFCSLLRF